MIFRSRRFILGAFAIVILGVMCYTRGVDTSTAIASIVIGIAAANSYQGKGATPNVKEEAKSADE
jgi:hypothetical protein